MYTKFNQTQAIFINRFLVRCAVAEKYRLTAVDTQGLWSIKVLFTVLMYSCQNPVPFTL
jgi:hypothetical protein